MSAPFSEQVHKKRIFLIFVLSYARLICDYKMHILPRVIRKLDVPCIQHLAKPTQTQGTRCQSDSFERSMRGKWSNVEKINYLKDTMLILESLKCQQSSMQLRHSATPEGVFSELDY